jgi:hypothetical protein
MLHLAPVDVEYRWLALSPGCEARRSMCQLEGDMPTGYDKLFP